MRVTFTGSNLAQQIAAVETLVQELQLAVGLALVPIIAAPAQSYSYVFTNRSPAAQIIRVGLAPTFIAPVAGMSLRPNDSYSISFVAGAWFAIADLAGGLLDCQVFSP